MPFLSKNKNSAYYIQTQKNKKGKEKDSYITHNTNTISHTTSIERASALISFHGSVTLEAALAIPIFFFAIICLLYLFEIMAVEQNIRMGSHFAAKKLAEEAYISRTVVPSRIEKDIAEAVGAQRLERSIIVGGQNGIHCEKSSMSVYTGEIHMVTEYKVKIPVPMFGELGMNCHAEFKMKGWTGYLKGGIGDGRETTVYVTDTGIVYHKDYHCTYLELSIKPVPVNSVDELRNGSGGKYYACERCRKKVNKGLVYITGTGDRYHGTLDCSGLKRTVYAIPLSEAAGKGACSRCGK